MSVLVTNFNAPVGGKPALLSVNEVTTLFHEFGHVMHASLTTAKYAALAGTNVATDFVEAPSQMLENWVFRPEVLAKISSDPSAPGKPIPEAIQKKIIEARKFDAGIKYSRQVFLGTFDFAIHTNGPKVNTDAVAKKLWKAIMGTVQDGKERFPASFGHMMGGYDGGYYGYLWSEVFAADMFTRFEKEGVLNPSVGRAYRDTILAKGRTVDASVLLEQFLGRAPSEKAFLQGLGIEGPQE
jgi:Zn-dependent oligopeptidase